MLSFWKFRVDKFEPQHIKNQKKNSWIKGNLANVFCQDQQKHKQVTMKKLLLLIDDIKKSWIKQHFCAYFFRLPIFVKYEFCACQCLLILDV